jgi:flagellar basal-body rod protein FlgF
MDNLTLAATSGLRSRMVSLDLLANNLANANTAGYKADREFYGIYSSAESEGAAGEGSNSSMPVVERQWTDFSPGVLQVTGNPLDIALPGKGFFVANASSGPLYTRNGNLTVLPSGELGFADGSPLQSVGGGTIQLAPGKPLDISAEGDVRQGGVLMGRISVVDFKDTSALQKQGATDFRNTDPRNTPTPVLSPGVQQGRIESSNVPVAESAMQIVGMMRQFEMLQKAISVSSEMDTKTIQEVARVGA